MARAGRTAVIAVGEFLILVFGLTWAAWGVVWQPGAAVGAAAAPAAAWFAPGGPVFLLGVFAPGLVALALSAREGGRDAVRALVVRAGRWRVPVRFYAFALLLVPVTKLAVAVLARALTGAWPAFGETRPAVLLGATLLSTLPQAGEELGWRGWLLPRLAARTGLAAASLIVGVAWAAWHLPLFFAPGADTTGQSFPLFAMEVTAFSAALGWLYWRTGGSLLLTMLAHAAYNNMKDIVPSAGSPAASPFTLDATPVLRLTAALLGGIAVVLLVRMRGARLGAGAAV